MMFGFYPPQKRNGKVVVMHSNAASVEIFKPNPTACPRVGELERAVRSSPEYMERRAAVEDILYELNSIEGTHGITPWESDVIEAWGDSLLTRMCNGMPFPCNSSGHCVASERARAVIDFYNYDSSKYLAAPEAGKLSGGYLMRYIYNRFAARAFNSTGPLYTHISAHDSTLTTALSALRYDMDGLPPYASTIVFELWKTSAGLHAVRALYNTVPIAPPECAANSTLCPLDNYRRMIENRLTVEDYDSECAVKGQ